MTLCGVCSPIYSELLEPILELIEGTYRKPMAASSGRGSCGSHMVIVGGGLQEVLRLEGSRGFSVNRGALGM